MRSAWCALLVAACVLVASVQALPCGGLNVKGESGIQQCEKSIREYCEGTDFELVPRSDGSLVFKEGVFWKVSFRKKSEGNGVQKILVRLVRQMCQPAHAIGPVTAAVEDALSKHGSGESAGGKAAFALLHSINGAPKSFDDVRRLFHAAELSVRAGRDLNIQFKQQSASVKITKDTMLAVGLTSTSLRLQFRPAIQLKKDLAFGIGPTVSVKSMTLELQEKPSWSFDAEGFGIDGVYEYILSWIASDWIGPMLPPKLRAGYYSIANDPNVDATMKELQRTLMSKLGADSGSTQAPTVDLKLSDLESASAYFAIKTNIKMFVPWQVKNKEDVMEMRVDIPSSTTFSLSARTHGPITQPKLRDIYLRLGHSGIEVNNIGTGVFDSIKGLKIQGLKILPRGKIRLIYDLQAENFMGGLVGLAKLLGMKAQLHTGQDLGVRDLDVPNVKVDFARKIIDEKVSVALEPAVAKFVSQYDTFLPGISLQSIVNTDTP